MSPSDSSNFQQLLTGASRGVCEDVEPGSGRGKQAGRVVLVGKPELESLLVNQLATEGGVGTKHTWLLFSHSVVFDSSAAPWTVALQAPLAMGLFRQKYWSGLPAPTPGGLPDPGRFFTTEPPGKQAHFVELVKNSDSQDPVQTHRTGQSAPRPGSLPWIASPTPTPSVAGLVSALGCCLQAVTETVSSAM